MYATMTSSMSASDDDVEKYFYEQTNQYINFMSITLREKTILILPQQTYKPNTSSFSFRLKHNSIKT
jgi:hypothetical protein